MTTREHPLMRAAAVLGDLGSPFYAEERQREVWNEASAVGFQFFLWGNYLLAAAMAWFGGRGLLPWTVALFLVTGIGGWITIAYAGALGVSGLEDARILGPRLGVYLALVVVLAAGLIHQSGGIDAVPTPVLVGAAIGGAAAAAGLTAQERRRRVD